MHVETGFPVCYIPQRCQSQQKNSYLTNDLPDRIWAALKLAPQSSSRES
jgi:hypothetical protein